MSPYTLRKDFVILQLYWWLFSSTKNYIRNVVILQSYLPSYNYQQDKSTYYDCWITPLTALKISARNLYCKITLVLLDFFECTCNIWIWTWFCISTTYVTLYLWCRNLGVICYYFIYHSILVMYESRLNTLLFSISLYTYDAWIWTWFPIIIDCVSLYLGCMNLDLILYFCMTVIFSKNTIPAGVGCCILFTTQTWPS